MLGREGLGGEDVGWVGRWVPGVFAASVCVDRVWGQCGLCGLCGLCGRYGLGTWLV